MSFEKDIFISYAHIDDEPLKEGEKGWISNFHRALEVRLAQLLGEKPVIWRDPKLQGNDYFGDEIVGQFPKIALLVSILSPRYVKSEWCVKEVKSFFQTASENIGIRIGNKARVFKVVKTPVELREHPQEIQDLLGYDFFKRDPETGRAKELDQKFGADAEQAYWAKLDDLAHDIRDLLEQIHKEGSGAAEISFQTQAEDAVVVYLSETSYDLKDERDNIKRELMQHGCRILPDQQLPLVTGAFQDQVRKYLEQCDLSVHLLGNSYGIVPDGTQQSVVELQNEVAAQISKERGLQRLIWIPSNLDCNDDRQKELIEKVRSNIDDIQYGADILERSVEDIKFAVQDKISKLKAPVPDTSGPADEGAPRQIYLICDQRDLDDTKPLEDFLFDQGFDVILPAFEGDESQVRLDHQENLKLCDAVMIYYGNGNDLWMRSKTRELLKINGYGRTKILLAKAVYVSTPVTPQKERFRSHDSIVVNGLNGFDAMQVKPFIDKMQSAVKT